MKVGRLTALHLTARGHACASRRKGLHNRWAGTDGSVNPFDLSMDWIISKTKPDFIGKRALSRESMGL